MSPIASDFVLPERKWSAMASPISEAMFMSMYLYRPSLLFPYTTLFRSSSGPVLVLVRGDHALHERKLARALGQEVRPAHPDEDRKSTRLNSSHVSISYAVFCLKKKSEYPVLVRDVPDRFGLRPAGKEVVGHGEPHLGGNVYVDVPIPPFSSLSLHDALPIFVRARARAGPRRPRAPREEARARPRPGSPSGAPRRRSEEHTSELQSRFDLVCRLLLEKKKRIPGPRTGCPRSLRTSSCRKGSGRPWRAPSRRQCLCRCTYTALLFSFPTRRSSDLRPGPCSCWSAATTRSTRGSSRAPSARKSVRRTPT